MTKSPARSKSDPALEINGWQIFAHPLLLDQLDRLIAAVERERARKPTSYRAFANFKLLAALSRLLFETVPQDPTRPEYRQGSTLGPQARHWFRAKFGGQRFRLFFRYSAKARIIIYAWVNDGETLRTYGARTEAYAVFAGMLRRGNPPDDWDALLSTAKASARRLRDTRGRQAKSSD
jgi:toxin YhaV